MKIKDGARLVTARIKDDNEYDLGYRSPFGRQTGVPCYPWDDPTNQFNSDISGASRLVWKNEDNIKEMHRLISAYRVAKLQHQNLNNLLNQITGNLSQTLKQQRRDAAFAAYLKEFGEPELWDREKEFKHSGRLIDNVCDAISYLVERHVPLKGLTVKEAWDKAKKLKWKPTKPNKDDEDQTIFEDPPSEQAELFINYEEPEEEKEVDD